MTNIWDVTFFHTSRKLDTKLRVYRPSSAVQELEVFPNDH